MNTTNDTTTALNLPFQYRGDDVRVTIDCHGNPWFVARDVAVILGYPARNTEVITRKIPSLHKGTYPIRTLGGVQNLLCVSEAGLYRLVLRSDKPEADPFIEWTTSEVLPAIRLTGAYVQAGQPKLPTDARELVAAVLDEKIAPVRNALDELHRAIRASLADFSDVPAAANTAQLEREPQAVTGSHSGRRYPDRNSPVGHWRREHLRRLASGKTVLVRAAEVNGGKQ